MEQSALILAIKISQDINRGVDVHEQIKELHNLCETDVFFITSIDQITNDLSDQKVEDILCIAKEFSKTAFMRWLNCLGKRNGITLEAIDNYKQQFGEDRDILLAEVMILFKEGYTNNQQRIDEIMKVIA